MKALGIDIGGSGIKGAPVDTLTGKILKPRVRLPTPVPSKPHKVAQTFSEIVKNFDWTGSAGAGFPSPVVNGVTLTAVNVHKKWVNVNAEELFSNASGCAVRVINDADAAGLAEMRFGAGKNRNGVVIMVTIGTGLGTALFTDGHLLPNAELGHIEINGRDAEEGASDAARKKEKMSWKQWTMRFDEYLQKLERLFSPELFILGGGVSKKHDKFIPQLTVKSEILPAQMLNDAGIVGAALAAENRV